MSRVYLDWNATTPPHPEVIVAMERALVDGWGNPSSVHARGREARRVVEDLREAIAARTRAHPRDVIFTSGGTEANNLALASATALALGRHEHPSVLRPAERLAAAGASVTWLEVGESGRVEEAALEQGLVDLPRGATVALMAANHETGVLQPLDAARRAVERTAAWLHVDAVQAFGKVDSAFEAAHSVALSAHKIQGPKGIGALVWRRSPAALAPLIAGGGQERGLRGGTLDGVAAAGFLAAVNLVHPDAYAHLATLRDELERALGDVARVNGSGPRLPHVSNLSFEGARGDELVVALDLLGIEVSAGSACSAGSQEPSAVVRAMAGEDRARQAVRFSMGPVTTREAVLQAIAALRRVLTRRSSSG
ncbi:MAG: cysteine desulfurase family protein [Polyangiaceae bacterium]